MRKPSSYSEAPEEVNLPVCVEVHLERTGARDPSVVWWAETVALPGFSAAEDTLTLLLASCGASLAELLPGEEIQFMLAAAPPATVGDRLQTVETSHADSVPRVLVAA